MGSVGCCCILHSCLPACALSVCSFSCCILTPSPCCFTVHDFPPLSLPLSRSPLAPSLSPLRPPCPPVLSLSSPRSLHVSATHRELSVCVCACRSPPTTRSTYRRRCQKRSSLSQPEPCNTQRKYLLPLPSLFPASHHRHLPFFFSHVRVCVCVCTDCRFAAACDRHREHHRRLNPVPQCPYAIWCSHELCLHFVGLAYPSSVSPCFHADKLRHVLLILPRRFDIRPSETISSAVRLTAFIYVSVVWLACVLFHV